MQFLIFIVVALVSAAASEAVSKTNSKKFEKYMSLKNREQRPNRSTVPISKEESYSASFNFQVIQVLTKMAEEFPDNQLIRTRFAMKTAEFLRFKLAV